MEIDELIIENTQTSYSNDLSESPLGYFKKGEWQKALHLSKQLFSDPNTQLGVKIEVYKSGCALACKLAESHHLKIGIKLTKALNKLIPEEHIQSFVQYQCEVLNYIACSYKQSLNLYLAKKYIDKAMLIVRDFPNINWNKSATYLNMCVILSALGKHFEASDYAKKAISLAKEEMVLMKFSQEVENDSKKAAVLAIAFHNYAVEEEFLGNKQTALEFYEKAYSFLKQHDPDNSEMIEKFKNSFWEARKIRQGSSRPSSAKSSANNNSIKSFASMKNPSKLPVRKLKAAQATKSASKTNFLDFKTECQKFLEKSNWAKNENSQTPHKRVQTNQTGSRTYTPVQRNFDYRPCKTEVVPAPAKGIENIRKPVFHEIAVKRQSEAPVFSFEDKISGFSVREKSETIKAPRKAEEGNGEVIKKIYLLKEKPKETLKETPKEMLLKETRKEVEKETLREVPKEMPLKETLKETLKEIPKEIPKETPKEIPKETPKENPKSSAKEIYSETPIEILNSNLIPYKNKDPSKENLQGSPGRTLLVVEPEKTRKEEKIEETLIDQAHISLEKSQVKPKEPKNLENPDEELKKKICKVQARVRGMITRKKYSLIKKKVKIMYKGAKEIGETMYTISIILKGDQKSVLITDRNKEIELIVPNELPDENILNVLDKNEQGFYFKDANENKENELIKNSKLKIEDDYYGVHYFYSKGKKSLTVRATKYSNSQVFSLEKPSVNFNSNSSVLSFINDEIEPFLQIKNLQLFINKEKVITKREFLAKGSRIFNTKEFIFTLNQVATSEGPFIEVLGQAKNDSKNYSELIPVSEALENINLLNIHDVQKDPHSILLSLHIQDEKIVLRKLDRSWLKLLLSEEKHYNNEPFSVKVYKVQNDSISYFFQVTSSAYPNLSSLSVSNKDLSSLFNLKPKKIKSSIADIVKSISVKSDSICFNPRAHRSTALLAREINIIVKIQSFIRGHLLRDRNRLHNLASPLIYSINRSFEGYSAAFNFFKLKETIFIEALLSDLNKSFYLFIDKPKLHFARFSRLYDIKCLANAIIFDAKTFLLPSLRGNIKFLECSFYSTEELGKSNNYPVIKFKLNTPSDYILLIRPLENGVIAKVMKLTSKPVCDFRVFAREEIEKTEGKYSIDGFARKIDMINGSIGVVSQVLPKKYQVVTTGEKVIFRTTVKFEEKLYSVTLAVESNEIMIFQFRYGSVSEQTIYVNLEEAYEMSGFSEGYIVPMTLFMLKKMFFLEDGKIALKPPAEKFDVKKSLLKIEAFIKGFRTRFSFRDKLNFKLIAKSPIKLNGRIFKVLFYYCNQDFNVCVIDYPLILTAKLNKKHIRNHEDKIEKIFISKILPKIRIKEKNGQKKIGGLQQWKKPVSEFSNVLETNPPLQTNRSGAETTPRVLKWRSQREISGKNCVVSVYESKNTGIIELLDLSNDETLVLQVDVSLIADPSFLVSQLELKNSSLSIKSYSPEVLLKDKRYLSNKLAEISIFSTEKGFFASALLVEENKTLNAFIGNSIDPEEAIKSLKIKEILGQEVLVIS